MYNTLFFFDRRIYVPGKDINLYLATIDHLIRDWKWSGKKATWTKRRQTGQRLWISVERWLISVEPSQKRLSKLGFKKPAD
jgi:hypothetical protein